jgi:hypothetical protein
MNRPLKILIRLLACTIAAILLVFGLFQWSVNGTFKSNNFIRLLPPHMVSNAKWLDLKMNSYYLAGLDSKTIYLCNQTAPAFILKTNYQLSDTTHTILQFSKTTAIYAEGIETIIDSPDIYSLDGLSAVIEHGTLGDYTLDLLKISNPNFNAGLPLTNSSFILRTFDTA